jgi:histidyl-tRNA synthetase
LCDECAEHLALLRRYLDALSRPYAMNHRLVRGLDYYTKTVFEVWAQGIGAQNAVCGGGRYDGLAEALGGDPTPGIGFGSGMERLVLLMKEQGIEAPGLPAPQVALAPIGQEAKVRALQLLSDLRGGGIRAVIGFGDRSLRAQLRGANRSQVAYAVILGDDEMAAGQARIQDMRSDAPPEFVRQSEVVATLASRLARA